MNKKFEYIDDNPGSYFGMLVESVEDKKNIKKKLNEDLGDNKLTYDSQLDFIKWYKESTGRHDGFYFDDVDCVDEFDSSTIPTVYCTGKLTWEEAKNRLIKYFDKQDRSLIDSNESRQFLKDFEYFCKKCECVDLSNVKQPEMIQNDKYTKVFGAYFKYPNSETIQLFTGKDLDDSWYRKYTATFDGKTLSEKYLNDLIGKIKKLLFKNSGNNLQISNINSNESLYNLAIHLNMISTDEEDYGFQSLYSRPAMSYSNSFKYNDIFKRDGKLAKKLNSITDGRVNAAFVHKDDPNIILVSMPKFNFLATRDMINGLNESLKENKFVPKDKMSKKAQKELNDKKRGTWGNTKPVTRVQPNKKAYDRKRDSKVVDERLDKQSDFELTYALDELEDLSKYYRTRQDGWSKKDSEEFLVDISNLLHRMQHLFRKAKVIDESKKLNESSDGWDEGMLSNLSYVLDKLANLQYEINNCVRGAYSHCTSYSELGDYIRDLGSELVDIADDVAEVEEDDEEYED